MQAFARGALVLLLASALISVTAPAAPAPQDQASGFTLASASAPASAAPASAPSTPAATGALSTPTAVQAAPQVVYQNGQLSISAENSTLRDILDAVHAQTGANIEGSAVNDSSRMVAHFGPGNVRTVLGDLIYGTRFNLMILTAPGSPERINRIVLTPKTTAGEMDRMLAADRVAAAAVEKSGRNSVSASANTSHAEGRGRASTTADAIPQNRPALPPGIPSEMWNLYPQLLQNNGLATPNPLPADIPPLQNARNPRTEPAAVAPPPGGYPALPRGIPVEMFSLYPPNLMQLIQNAAPPPAPAPRPTTVPSVLWDQALPVQH